MYSGNTKVWSSAEGYTVNFLTSPLTSARYSIGCDEPNFNITSDMVSLSFNDGFWQGGFPRVVYEFTLKNVGCKKMQFTITSGSGTYHEVIVNERKYSDIKTHIVDIPEDSETVSVRIVAQSYAVSGGTGYSASVTVRNMALLEE